MKKIHIALITILLTALFFNKYIQAKLPFDIFTNDKPSVAPIIKEVAGSVVNITISRDIEVNSNTQNRFFSNPFSDPFFRKFFSIPEGQQLPKEEQKNIQRIQSVGSGVIIDSEIGYIVTNNHVVEGAKEIFITTTDEREFEATIIGSDTETDIAILKVKNPENLTSIQLGDSDNLEVGDFVIAIGNPFGLRNTVTTGIISGLGRNRLGIESYEDFIQTDAAINRGNSGGALINFNGKLVGLNTAIFSDSGGGNLGIGFAIPVNMVKIISAKLIEDGKIERGLIGVFMQDIDEKIADYFNLDSKDGALVSSVVDDSSADKAGILAGDVIVAINDEAVKSPVDVRNKVGYLSVGEEVNLTIVRNSKTLLINLELGKRESLDTKKQNTNNIIRKEKLTEKFDHIDLLEGVEFNLVDNEVRVYKIENNSKAQRAGLAKGDVIVSVNNIPIKNFSDFDKTLDDSEDEILFYVNKQGFFSFIVLK